jgi:PASTA domain
MSLDAKLVMYSTVRDTRLSEIISEYDSPDTALLEQIQQLLSAADNDYVGRRYQNAVSEYKQAGSLIWSQLDHGTKVSGLGGKLHYDQSLLTSMLQMSLGWLGVLTVPALTWTILVTVPNVMGSSKQQAGAQLLNAHLTLGSVSLDNGCIDFAGYVLNQIPSPGDLVPESTNVRLTVSSGLDQKGHKCVIIK